MKKTITWSPEHIPSLKKALNQGGVVVGTSDTVFGLLAATDQRGFNALNSIKARSEKPYLVITESSEKAIELCENSSDMLKNFMHACWPGPITIIVKAKKTVPSYMTSKEGTVAIRVPDHDGFKLLLKEVPYLFSTSANLSGNPVPRTKDDLDAGIIDQCAFVVVDEKTNTKNNEPSTIVDITQIPFKVIRTGAFSLELLKRKWRESF